MSDIILGLGSKDIINLLILRLMEVNIILIFFDVKVELIKVRFVVIRYKVYLWNFI